MPKTSITHFSLTNSSADYCYQHDDRTGNFTIGKYNSETNELDDFFIYYDITKMVRPFNIGDNPSYFLMIRSNRGYSPPRLDEITLTRFNIKTDGTIVEENVRSLRLDDIIDVNDNDEYENIEETAETVKFLEATKEDGEKVRISFTTTNGGYYPTLSFV